MSEITICDSTLRDGSHAVRHCFTTDQVIAVAGALDGAGLDVIEVSHGDGLAGSSFNYGFSAVDELELIAAAAGVLQHARLAVLLLPVLVSKRISSAPRAPAQALRGSQRTRPKPTSLNRTSGCRASLG